MTYNEFKTTCKDAGLKIVEYEHIFSTEAYIDIGSEYNIYEALIARYYNDIACADLHTLGKGWETIKSVKEFKNKIKESISSYIYWKKFEKMEEIKKSGEAYDI